MTSNYSLRTITDLEPGDHLCCLYETEEEHRALLTSFLRQGLERGEKVLYIVDVHTTDTVLGYLQDDGREVEPYLASGQLSILIADDVYIKDGIFDPDRTIAMLETETERALAEGYSALRATGEMAWVLRGVPGSERLIELESKVNTFFSGSRCLTICQYDRRHFRRRSDSVVLLDVLAVHPTVVVGTDIYDNFYYIPPTEFLGQNRPAATLRHWLENLAARKRAEEILRKAHDELEIQIQERTVELIEANKALRAEITERKQAEESLRESLAQLSKKNRYETIISTVTRSVHQSINLQEVLENAVEAMSKNIDEADAVSIYLVEEKEAVLKTHRGYADLYIERAGRIPYPRGTTWKTIIEGKPRYVADVDQDMLLGPAGREMGIKSYLSMPIRFGDKTVGTLNIASFEKSTFDEEELKLMEIVAQQIEIAINNAKQAELLYQANEELELRVQERTQKLSEANEELKQEIAERKRVEETLRKRAEQVVHYQTVLLELAKMDSSDLDSALNRITEVDAKTLRVERVGVWLFNEDGSEIICKDLYKMSKNLHENGVGLKTKDYPGYFRALEESRILAADDARTDPRTSEYAEGYLKPFGISSMMDVPIRLHGKIVGIVCHEHTGPMREWTVEEQDFVASIADTVSLSLEASERKRAEEQIKASLKEKEVLLKEVQHRVKNNLQVISSLLRLQSEYTKEKETIEMFNETENRVQSMALIHEILYQSQDLSRINFDEYIRNLGVYLFQSYGVKSHEITLKINVDDISLGVDTAITCGLIINELVSNSLKHAFPRKKKGEIRIALNSDNGTGDSLSRPYTLIVGDNGVGFPKGLDFRNTESLGLQLVITLIKKLKGSIELYRDKGTEFKIMFKELK